MQIISATYCVTTPMFVGGADPRDAEFRLPSFKGALRFWWRALAWEHTRDVEQLRREEAALFGSSDENVGQSKVLMRLAPFAAEPTRRKPPEQLKDFNDVVGDGVRYLGYGVMEAFASRNKGTKEGQLIRSCLLAPFVFTVELLLKPEITSNQQQQIEQALKAAGLFGGLGSKTRKGFGSLTLLSVSKKHGNSGNTVQRWQEPRSVDDLKHAVVELLGPNRLNNGGRAHNTFTALPDWTAFSPESRVIILPADPRDKSPLALLDRVGREMIRYRSWGHKGSVFGQESEKNFRDDHDLMKTDWRQRRAHPRRVAFGLPHNYGNSSTEHVEPAKEYDRRASPIFIHIHQVDDTATPIAIVSLLPSLFLPQEAAGLLVGKREHQHRGLGNGEQQTVPLTDDDEFWRPLTDFLDRLHGRTPKPNDRKEPFGQALEVTHG